MKSQIEHQFAQLSRIELTLKDHDDRISKNQNATTVNAAGTQKNAGQMAGFEQRLGVLELETNSRPVSNEGMKEDHEKTIRTEKKLIIETQQQIEASKIELLATHDSLTAKYRYSVKALYAAHTTELKKRQRIIENSESRINDENTTFRRNTVTFSQAEN